MKHTIFVFVFLILPILANAQRDTLSLAGIWNSSLGSCRLPGTTDENKLGSQRVMSGPTTELTRLYPYKGKVIYERNIILPPQMAKRTLSLYMERSKRTTLFIDGDSIGSITQLFAPHIYKLPKLKGGNHHITLIVDNSDEVVPSGIRGSHAWTDATQTNWNGIIGKFAIIATSNPEISDLQLYPNAEKRTILAKLTIKSDKPVSSDIDLQLKFQGHSVSSVQKSKIRLTEGINFIEHEFSLGEDAKFWSEFHPNLYQIQASLKTNRTFDCLSRTCGLRTLSTDGTQLLINGYKTFLRGTHDGCVFPLTGYAPADIDTWRRLFTIVKQYGFNHVRFHSYTPTEAAFEAADQLGIYLHTERPLWGTINNDTKKQNEFLRNEALTTLRFLGNHPSFTGLGLGNELWGDVEIMRSWLDEFRRIDARHLYSMGSNNNLGWNGPQDGDDIYITCRAGEGKGFSTHTRSSFSFADAEQGGILNANRPNSTQDYATSVKLCKMPIVSHESCQFQIYPDYQDIPKYTGVLYPYNLITFRDRLKENGLSQQIDAFHQSSGQWSVLCDKADMEICLRTKGFGGYQMLDIKDYPGQGSALVGILDAFMDSKNLVTPETFREWNAPLVPLAKLKQFCFKNSDTLQTEIIISNYLESDYAQPLSWTLSNDTWSRIGEWNNVKIKQGDVGFVGNISLPLNEIKQNSMLTLTLKTGNYQNSYHLWVYANKPADMKALNDGNNHYIEADTLSEAVFQTLQRGGNVLLTPKLKSIQRQSVGGLFTPDYWNYAMFKSICENNKCPVSPGTLGLLMNPNHPVFKDFPTENHTDWQWWPVALNSRPLILNSLPKTYFPIIQVVDNIERNHKLGILLEAKVGKGCILIATTDLKAISQYPEGEAYATSVRNYAQNLQPNSLLELTISELQELLYGSHTERVIKGVKNISDYKQK